LEPPAISSPIDWQALVRERLSGRGLSPSQQGEVVVELAAHLEDHYEEQRTMGACESDALRRALDDAADWCRLARKIRQSKLQEGQMNNRTRRLWLPGFASLTTTLVMLVALNRIGDEPRIFWHGTKFGMNLVLPWLIAMPVFGGLGAYLSRLGNGNVKARLVAALFPAIVIFGVFCFSIAVSEVMWHVLPIAFARTVLNWVFLPGALLFLGALPFLRNSRGPEVGEVDQASC
jgi:hypothetical protein